MYRFKDGSESSCSVNHTESVFPRPLCFAHGSQLNLVPWLVSQPKIIIWLICVHMVAFNILLNVS